jgi:hypothetical protein
MYTSYHVILATQSQILVRKAHKRQMDIFATAMNYAKTGSASSQKTIQVVSPQKPFLQWFPSFRCTVYKFGFKNEYNIIITVAK